MTPWDITPAVFLSVAAALFAAWLLIMLIRSGTSKRSSVSFSRQTLSNPRVPVPATAGFAKGQPARQSERPAGVQAGVSQAIVSSASRADRLAPAEVSKTSTSSLFEGAVQRAAGPFDGSDTKPVQQTAEKRSPAPQVAESLNRVGGTQEEPSLVKFYGLAAHPFDVAPDPSYLYLSPLHREALVSLSEGIRNLRGFMALIAEPGMGKTTLLNKLMDEFRDSARIVFLFQTQCSSRELLGYLLSELDVDYSSMDGVAMHRALNQALLSEMFDGKRFVLIVDEAQNLGPAVLETIRLLSDFETPHSKLLQIILAGQPQLGDTLMRPELSQLRQRIAILANLEALNGFETPRYVMHRLRTAGANGEPIFTAEALALIAELSHGTPRTINNLCFNALQLGHAEKVRKIGAPVVQRAAAKLDLESFVRRHRRVPVGDANVKTGTTAVRKLTENLNEQ